MLRKSQELAIHWSEIFYVNTKTSLYRIKRVEYWNRGWYLVLTSQMVSTVRDLILSVIPKSGELSSQLVWILCGTLHLSLTVLRLRFVSHQLRKIYNFMARFWFWVTVTIYPDKN